MLRSLVRCSSRAPRSCVPSVFTPATTRLRGPARTREDAVRPSLSRRDLSQGAGRAGRTSQRARYAA